MNNNHIIQRRKQIADNIVSSYKSMNTSTTPGKETLLRDGKVIDVNTLSKGRQYQIGEISQTTGLKKVAPGKWVDPKTGKEVKSNEEETQGKRGTEQSTGGSKYTPEQLAEHAKNASLQDLEKTIKESPDENLRKVAHQELDRRKKEEHISEEPDTKNTKKEEIKKDPYQVGDYVHFKQGGSEHKGIIVSKDEDGSYGHIMTTTGDKHYVQLKGSKSDIKRKLTDQEKDSTINKMKSKSFAGSGTYHDTAMKYKDEYLGRESKPTEQKG